MLNETCPGCARQNTLRRITTNFGTPREHSLVFCSECEWDEETAAARRRAASPYEKNLPGRCCCCGLGTDLFEYGHWWCSVCEGRGHNNATWARELGKEHGRSGNCFRMERNYLEDIRKPRKIQILRIP